MKKNEIIFLIKIFQTKKLYENLGKYQIQVSNIDEI